MGKSIFRVRVKVRVRVRVTVRVRVKVRVRVRVRVKVRVRVRVMLPPTGSVSDQLLNQLPQKRCAKLLFLSQHTYYGGLGLR